MKKETIEEFLARGGKITKVPPGPRPEDQTQVKVKQQFNYDVMSLGDGEFYFGETRSKAKDAPKVTGADFTKMVETSNLPPHIVEALKKAVKNDGK